ncbi:MAG TPA: Uma2 family endonuclease [Schlesneria sp.]|jgi:Uma2 family endonuclease
MATVITELGTNLTLPDSFGSLAVFRNWVHSGNRPERGRFTFVSGGLEIDMSPERISGHNDIKTRMTTALDTLVESHNLGVVFGDGVLLVNEEAGLGCEPDMMFCSIETLSSGKVTYRAWQGSEEGDVELHGSPDMVAEIVSNSSVRKDTIELRRAYFVAGVTEYWLIDGRDEEIEFQLLIRGQHAYEAVEPDAEGYQYSPTFGRAFRFIREAHPVSGIRCRLLAR